MPEEVPGQPEESKPVSASRPAAPMPEGVQPYELAADDPSPARPASKPKGVIEKPGLLSDFDEDADFDRDPEVERAMKGGDAKSASRPAPGSDTTEGENNRFVRPGRGTAKTMLIVGAAIAFAASIAAVINAPSSASTKFFVALGALFEIALHTVTGVGAIGLAAAMLGKVLRNFELAGARMLVATSLFALGFQLDFHSPAHTLGLGLAAGSYFLAVLILFKIKPRDVVVIAAFHFALWILFYLHYQVSVWATPAAGAAQAVAPAVGG